MWTWTCIWLSKFKQHRYNCCMLFLIHYMQFCLLNGFFCLRWCLHNLNNTVLVYGKTRVIYSHSYLVLALFYSQIWVPSNPRGAERLPPRIVAAESDLYLRRLWGNPNEVSILQPLLYATFNFKLPHMLHAILYSIPAWPSCRMNRLLFWFWMAQQLWFSWL
jgi:hypothetical protein